MMLKDILIAPKNKLSYLLVSYTSYSLTVYCSYVTCVLMEDSVIIKIYHNLA